MTVFYTIITYEHYTEKLFIVKSSIIFIFTKSLQEARI